MVLEDNDDHAFLAKQALIRASRSAEVYTFPNGRAALNWLDEQKGADEFPNLILMDLDMPELDGLEFLKIYHDHYSRMDSPVILLTSSMNEKDVREAYRLGAAGYIAKPLNLSHNLRKLQNYLDMLQIPLTVWPCSQISNTEGILA